MIMSSYQYVGVVLMHKDRSVTFTVLSIINVIKQPTLAKVIEEKIIERSLYGYEGTDNYSNLGEKISLSTWSVFFNITDDSNVSADVKSAYDELFKSTGSSFGVWSLTKLYFALDRTIGLKVISRVPILGGFISGVQKAMGSGTFYQIS